MTATALVELRQGALNYKALGWSLLWARLWPYVAPNLWSRMYVLALLPPT